MTIKQSINLTGYANSGATAGPATLEKSGPYKANIIQGDDVDLNIVVKDKKENPLDMSGASAITFQIKKEINGDALVAKTLGSGITLASPATELTVALTAANTGDDTLDAGKYYFELQITDGGNVTTVRDFDDQLGLLEVFADLDQ